MPRSARASTDNLPLELTSFVGRRRELGDVKQLLGESRLVTLTGVGGAGKTRLALRVAAELRRAFGAGVWFVDLAQLDDSKHFARQAPDEDMLAYLVAVALGVRLEDTGSAVAQLAERLAAQHALLVLDNCEHLLPACALMVDALLRRCHVLRVLATSREPLAVSGELLYAVPPLAVPDRTERSASIDVARYESVALFVARAQTAKSGFSLTDGNRQAVAELCQRLDGLPLAIELAAARARVLTPEQMLDRIVDRFTLLSRGSRNAPTRQQTLRACVEWSFDLCSKPERVLWARLSVFVGGFELDAVEGVCADKDLPGGDLLDVLAGLVDKSIIDRVEVVGAPGEHARYRMLGTIRAFGQERLAETGDVATLRRRHLDWYEQLVARANAEWVSDRQAYWLARLDLEYPNLRAAAEHCLSDGGDVEGVLRIAVSLPPQWRISRDMFGEELRRLEMALTRSEQPTVLRARALLVAAYLAGRRGDVDYMMRRLDEGAALARRLHDAPAEAFAAFEYGAAAMLRNDLPAAIEILKGGLTFAPASAQPEFASAVRLQLLFSLGVAYGLTGESEQARGCYEEILQITQPRGEGFNQSRGLWGLGLVTWLQGDSAEGAKLVRQGLRLSRDFGGDGRYAGLCIEMLAWIVASQHHFPRAAMLLGAAHTLRTHHDKPIASYRWMAVHHEECERRAREALGDAGFAAAFSQGQALSAEDVVAFALDERRQAPPYPAKKPAASALLTRREREVAALVAEGRSNKAIAATLVISQRTAETHVERILTKLGFTSRAQVAAWLAE